MKFQINPLIRSDQIRSEPHLQEVLIEGVSSTSHGDVVRGEVAMLRMDEGGVEPGGEVTMSYKIR